MSENWDREAGKEDSPYQVGEASTKKALPGLFWGELDEGRPSQEEAKEVCPYVVAGSDGGGQHEPDEALEHVGNCTRALHNDDEECYVAKRKLFELVPILG